MRIVFFGTPDYVEPVVEGLLKHFRSNSNPHPIAAVVTQSPKPSGREKKLTYSPVDDWAYRRKIAKYFDPADLIRENISADIGVLASYGKIIPDKVIKLFRFGILNIHPSLLPLWRGASPIQASIISGNTITGVSIIKLDNLLDHGPIVSQFKDEIKSDDTAGSLRWRLFDRSSEVMPGLIEAYVSGKTKLKSQDEKSVTLTRQIKKSDAFIPEKFIDNAIKDKVSKTEKFEVGFVDNLSITPDAQSLTRFIRAMDPWPTAWTNILINKTQLRIKILKAHVEETQLVLDEVQLEGKSPVSWKQFMEGYPKAKFSGK